MYHTHVSRTPISPPITYAKPLFSLGSCFADEIGGKLASHRFDIWSNPYGTLYNPYTICKHLRASVEESSPYEEGFVEVDGLVYHHDFHSEFRAESAEHLSDQINHIYTSVNARLVDASHVMITLGSAFVYRQVDSGMIVGNCHKVPQANFEKEMLSARAIVTRLSSTLLAIWETNPALHVILTVSPVRYFRDGAVNNTRSKAQLITACMLLEERHNQVTYYPSYEIMMDELRGYRWVKSDLVHPNEEAVDVVWEAFVQSAMSEETIATLDRVKQLNAQLNHKPFNPKSESHQLFVKNLRSKIQAFKKEYPHISISEDEITL